MKKQKNYNKTFLYPYIHKNTPRSGANKILGFLGKFGQIYQNNTLIKHKGVTTMLI